MSARSMRRDLAELKSSYSKAAVLVTYRMNRSQPAVKEIEVVSQDCTQRHREREIMEEKGKINQSINESK